MPLHLVVFDLDGTLIDSRRDLASATNRMLAEFGGAPLAEDRIVGMVGAGARVLVSRALAAAGLDVEPSVALARFVEIYDTCLLDHTRPYSGIEGTLTALAARVRLAVLTNKPERHTRRILQGLALDRFFGDAVVGGDSGFPRKPDPAALLHLAHTANAEPDTTMLVGDSPVDLETARRAGSRICLAKYGFGFRFGPGELNGVEHVIDEPGHLVGLIDRLIVT